MLTEPNENIEKFTKGTFQLREHGSSGLKYIAKTFDEKTKNHQLDMAHTQTACMPEVKGSKFCPVSSYLKYLSHLNPLIPNLWQYPKENEKWLTSEVWYTNKPIGANLLASFMSRMSHIADLSQSYTNHSIRVTGTTYLTRSHFSANQIMAITGHKSINSLAIYQKVSTDEKLAMAYAMSCYLQAIKSSVQPTASLGAPVQPTASITANTQEKINSEKALVPLNANSKEKPKTVTPSTCNEIAVTTHELETSTTKNTKQIVQFESEDPFEDAEIPDFDLGEIMETIEKEQTLALTQTSGPTTTTNMMHQRQFYKKTRPQIPVFNNCKIGNINITINKK